VESATFEVGGAVTTSIRDVDRVRLAPTRRPAFALSSTQALLALGRSSKDCPRWRRDASEGVHARTWAVRENAYGSRLGAKTAPVTQRATAVLELQQSL